METDKEFLSQYTRIATDIAARIAEGKYPEFERLPGKSSLATIYEVSPETVRKALNILSDCGVLQCRTGSGTVVISKKSAELFLEGTKLKDEQAILKENLRSLILDYRQLGQKIVEISENLIDARYTPLPTDQQLPFYEVTVPADSDKANMSLGDMRFWQSTGATIVAIKRGQHIQISPGPYAIIKANDILVYVGEEKTRKAVHQFLTYGKIASTIFQIQEQINTAIHMKELSAAAEALGARIGDISDFTAMTKGMTNHSYLFSCKGSRYILRIPGEGTFNLIDRYQEEQVYRAIAGTGICDDVIYINPENGLKVTRFIDEVRPCDPDNTEDLEKCMGLLRRFHGIGLKVEHYFDLFGNIQHYEDLWAGEPSAHKDYKHIKSNVLGLKDFVEKQRGELCLTHIDAVPDNFLFHNIDGTESLQLIDWEYAGMQDPHVDIAMFCIYSSYDKEQIDKVIDIYFEGSCSRADRAKIYCYVSICGLLWSNWTEYKRCLGVEYGDYAKKQYAYAKEYYKIARKEISAIEGE